MKRTYPIVLAVTLLLAACEADRIPSEIHVFVSPARLWYHTGQTIQLDAEVVDSAGEDFPDAAVVWTVEPAGAATMGAPLEDPRDARFTLDREGVVIFTACTVPSADSELVEPLCDSLRVRVDDGQPSLEVETPTPGQEITGDPEVVVRGSVADHSMVDVYINGTPAVVDEMGRFEGSVAAVFGVNHLTVSATDGLTETAEVEMDVLWAPEFTPALSPDGTPLLSLDDGLTLWLGQDFFDDGTPIDTTARPATTSDLADVLQLVIASLDVDGFIPDPVYDSPPTFTLHVTDARIDEPHVEIDLTDDGADLFVRLGRVSAQTSGVLMVEGTSLPLTGQVSGSAVAFAHLTIRKDGEAAELEVELGELSVGLESVQGTFVSNETAAVFRLAEGLFRTTLETALVDALEGTLAASVPDLLRDALRSIDTALSMQSIELMSDPFPPVRIEIDGRIRELRSTFRRDLVATLRTSVGTTTPTVHPESLGVPRLTTLRALPFVNQGSLQLGVRLALLNGLLHSLWASGLLDVDATSILPASVSGLVSSARIVGRMQPLLRPGRPDEEDALVLSVGQLELELTFMGEPVVFGMSLDAGVSIDLASNRISVDVAETPRLRIWTLVAPSNPRLLTPDTVETLLLDFWPQLRESVVGGLAFDLPIPALGDLGGIAPDLAGLTLQIDQRDATSIRRGVLVMEAGLTGELP
ncbi:MAG: hypothetical protein H6719_23050 [Sandaracinaceae bacterium]|nr:hypothetical protein [Sandaracinaceae bacterium]